MKPRLPHPKAAACLAAAAFLCAAWAADPAPEASVAVKLKTAPMKTGELFFGAADTLGRGRVTGSKSGTAKNGSPVAINLDGKLLEFDPNHRTVSMGGKPAGSFVVGPAGVNPMPVKLGGGRTYVLGFPSFSISKEGTHWYAASYALEAGSAAGLPAVALHDDDVDGTYQFGKDSIALGRNPVLGVLLQKGAYYTGQGAVEVEEVDSSGAEIKLRKADKGAGKLVVKFGGKLAGTFSLAGPSGATVVTEGPSSDLAVPPGTYTLSRGILTEGSKPVACVANDRSSSKAKPVTVEVEADKPAELKLGAPFQIRFTAKRAGDKINISPDTFSVQGAAGETYSGFNFRGNPRVALVAGSVTPIGAFEFGWGGGLCAYSGGIPKTIKDKTFKVQVDAEVEGLGKVTGQVDPE